MGGVAFTWYITLYTILVQKWGVGAYMVMGAYKVLYSNSDFVLWEPKHGKRSVGEQAKHIC